MSTADIEPGDNNPGDSDELTTWLARAIEGDRDALGRLLEVHASELRRAIDGKIDSKWRSQLSEDDVLQQTYADAFLGIRRFKAGHASSLRAWLITLARNNLRDAIRHLQASKNGGGTNRAQPGSDESYHRLMQQISANISTPSIKAARGETSEQLTAAIRRLPSNYARIIEAFDLGDTSAEEIACEFECSIGAFYMRRARAHAMLARQLSKLSGEYNSE